METVRVDIISQRKGFECPLPHYQASPRAQRLGYDLKIVTMHECFKHSWLSVLLVAANKRSPDDTMVEYADKLFNVARARSVRVGRGSPVTALTYNNIGLVLLDKGDLKVALSMYEKCRMIQEKVLVNDYPYMTKPYSNIGSVFYAKGDWDEALAIFEKCRITQQKVLGEEHPSTATTYSNISTLVHSKGDFDGALAMLEKCRIIREEVLEKDHPDTATTFNEICLVFQSSDCDRALSMYEKYRMIREKLLGNDHPSTAISYINIGLMLEEKNCNQGALVMFDKCRINQGKVFRTDHEDTRKK